MSRVSPKVDIIDMLQKASVPNFATDGSAAKQIKELSAEVTKLKWLREERRSSRFQSNLFLVPLGKIRYPWKPSRCSKCKVFGHNECSVPDVVPKAEGKIWVVKQGPSLPATGCASPIEEKGGGGKFQGGRRRKKK
ncbi:uncharacterized protein LOC131329517 isoform X3 [Rhododendron vialii]|uniref:uncharacterized protein LOC131329517 isoform X3 n=1 Tax=Rhododendron vialii TaxID=182163 RepID=UPI00265E13CA|nr:uncharacterized protein LOC131329517 isoform X3 [Rhododendron vialii]